MKLREKITRLIPMIILCAVTLCCPLGLVFANNEGQFKAETDIILSSGKWLYCDRGDSVCISGYTGTDSKITIPSEIDGKKVTGVSAHKIEPDIYGREYAFFEDYNQNTREVVVPEGVVSIGKYTFSLSKIEKTELPKSLIAIDNRAYEGCSKLTSIRIPENVKMIGDCAFANSGLTEIYLPEGLESIGKYAFSHSLLKRIYIPPTVKYIGEFAFQRTGLEEAALPESLIKAERGLFAYCGELKRAYLSEGITVLDYDVFYGCQSLDEVYFPSTLREINKIFKYNDSLKSLYFAADEEESKRFLGNYIMRSLTDDNPKVGTETASEYKDVKTVYGTPVPQQKPIPYPEAEPKTDKTAIFLMAAAAICFILTAVFLTLLIYRKKQAAKAKAEKEEKAREGFRPEILGIWQCKKCGTLNSPIGNYCYKCGRKGEK